MKHLFNTLIIIAMVFCGSSCTKDDNEVSYPSFDEYLKSKSNLSMFSQSLDKAQLGSFKNGQGPFTWFAPSNDAFIAAGITQDSLNKMTAGTASYLLLYQLINPTSIPLTPVFTRDMIAQNSFAKTTQVGQNIYVGNYNDSFYVNGSSIIDKDIRVSNGVVHVLNRFNVPPVLRGNIQGLLNSTGQHSLFIAALTRANRWAALGTGSVFTVLAPTDAAMTAAGYSLASINSSTVGLMDSLVRYHMFSNNRLFTNDLGNKTTPGTMLGPTKTIQSSNIGKTFKGLSNATTVDAMTSDILGTNGIVHSIKGVLRY